MFYNNKKKRIILRFVEMASGSSLDNPIEDGNKKFALQKKTILGWKTFRYAMGGSPAGVVYGPYTDNSKDKLIKTVLNNEYNTSPKHCTLRIYPTVIEI